MTFDSKAHYAIQNIYTSYSITRLSTKVKNSGYQVLELHIQFS